MLSEEQRSRLAELFALGVDVPPAERARFCRLHCTTDPELRSELESLLACSDEADSFLVTPILHGTSDRGALLSALSEVNEPYEDLPSIGHYRILETIAKGGMGIVYRAHQERPVRRDVALKCIKPGTDSHAVLARFEAERQALARMNHRGIAQVFDAGLDEAGRPYFVMEFVEGTPITEYCERADLSLRARVSLLCEVCLAVQHAHQRGVIHRDLKPSNILVTLEDGRALPKVIDFGIAKAIDGRLGEQTIRTESGAFLGTPEYMSPEQCDGVAIDVDTRSDVYSLGVILYQLLVGELPFSSETLRSSSYTEIRRILLEEQPRRPSVRVGQGPSNRADPTELRHLARSLRGELDWITMRALEKEPDRRYASPLELANDLERFLRNEPVQAGPPSTWYVARKLVRRHRNQFTAMVGIAVAVLGGLFASTHYMLQAQESAALAAAQRDFADGVRLAVQARTMAVENPTLALLLALEASQLAVDHTIQDSIYATLPHHRELRTLIGHDSHVRSVEFHPDGRRVLSHADEPAALIWDADSGEILHRLVGGQERLRHAAFSGDGKLTVSASEDGKVLIWDTDTGQLQRGLPDHQSAVRWAEFNRDGTLVLTGCDDRKARLFDLASGRCVATFDGHENAIRQASISEDGRLVATTTIGEKVARVFEADTGRLLATLGDPDGTSRFGVRSLYFLSSGSLLLAAGGADITQREVRLYRPDGSVVERFIGQDQVAVSRDRNLFVARAGSRDGHEDWVRYDVRRRAVTGRSAVGSDDLLATSLDGSLFLGAEGPLVDLESGLALGRLAGHVYIMNTACFSPDGRRIATGAMDRTVRIWSASPATGPDALLRGETLQLDSLHVTPEGRLGFGQVRTTANEPLSRWVLVDLDSRAELWSMEQERAVELLASANGRVFVGLVGDPRKKGGWGQAIQRVLVWNREGELTLEFEPEQAGSAASLRPDGGELALFRHGRDQDDTAVHFYDLHSGRQTRSTDHADRALSVCWSPDLTQVAIMLPDAQRTLIHDRGTGNLVHSLAGHTGSHQPPAFSADGRWFMTISVDRSAVVWDLESGEQKCRARSMRGIPNMCGFAGDPGVGWYLVENSVLFFDTRSGERLGEVVFAHDSAARLAVNLDGTELLALTKDGNLQHWPVDPIAYARTHVPRSLQPDELSRYRIGTPDQQSERTRLDAQARPTPSKLNNAGQEQARRGHLDEAIELVKRATELGPHQPDPWTQLAILWSRKGHRSAALEALEHALAAGLQIDAATEVPELAPLLRDRSLRNPVPLQD